MSILADEFWKKCMKKDGDKVYYNLDQEYIELVYGIISTVPMNQKMNLKFGLVQRKRIISDKDDPKDTDMVVSGI